MTNEKSINDQLNTTTVLWNLEDLYLSTEDSSLQQEMDWALQEGKDITDTYSGKINSLDANNLTEAVRRIEALECKLSKLATYSFLNFTTQVDNEEAGAFNQKIKEFISQVEKDLIFFELEWNSLPDEDADRLLEQEILKGYRHHLSMLRRYKPHQLSKPEEKLLIERQIVGRSSWLALFQKVFGHLKFGEKKRTEEEVLTDLYNEDRSVRKTAAAEMTEGLQSQNHILTHIFNTLAADKMVNDRQRSYQDWVSSMNLDNQIVGSTVDALINVVTGRYDIVSRYYTLKKDLLGLDTLYDYDRYAPLPALTTSKVTWDDCKKTVLDAFQNFSPKMEEIASRFFSENYIHAPVLPGKRGGAFAHPCVPEVHPYIMVNYTGNLRDVSTVAHELGHGIHQVLAAEKGYYYTDTPLVLAETASVFAELLVFKAQVEMLNNEDEKRAFICQKLESIFATVFRQTAMNRFEHGMHEARRKEGELASDQLSAIWMSTQQEMFGDSVILSKNYSLWWSYIPHFLSTPGYVYSYAFGELLVLSLYSFYEQEGDSFIEKYLTLLSAGGSATPYDLLAPFNINLNDKTFWNKGLDLLDNILKEVE